MTKDSCCFVRRAERNVEECWRISAMLRRIEERKWGNLWGWMMGGFEFLRGSTKPWKSRNSPFSDQSRVHSYMKAIETYGFYQVEIIKVFLFTVNQFEDLILIRDFLLVQRIQYRFRNWWCPILRFFQWLLDISLDSVQLDRLGEAKEDVQLR